MATAAERIGEFVARLRLGDVPASVVARARAQMLSVLGAVRAGAPTQAVRPLYSIVRQWGAKGRAPLVPFADTTSPDAALLATASASMVHDYDDYLLFGHTGHSAVLVPLLLGAELGASGEAVLSAQIAANEVEGRIGGAVALGPHNGQMWAHIHAIGAATAAAKLFGLDAAGTAHAATLALAQPPYALVGAFMGSSAKALTAAQPAVAGLLAARLARDGWTGSADLIESRHGFLRAFAYAPLPDLLTGFGRVWVTATTCVKPYPGCAYVDAPVEALLAIVEKEGIQAAEIERIDVAASALTCAMQQLSAAHAPSGRVSPTNVNFSVPGSLAIAARDHGLDPQALEPEALARGTPELRALAARIHVRHDWSMTHEVLRAIDEAVGLRHLFATSAIDWPRALRRVRDEAVDRLGVRLAPGPSDLVALARIAGWGGAGLLDAVARRWRRRGDGAERRYDLGESNVERATFPFAAEVTVRARGRVFAERVTHPRGTTGASVSVDNVAREKILAEYRRQGGDARGIVETVQSLAERPVADLVRALADAAPPED